MPADDTATESLCFWICAAKRADAIGDRQMLAVQTKRT
jgi:hypothetical protein